MQIFDDCGRLENRRLAIDKQRELADRRVASELGAVFWVLGIDHSELERRVVLVERDKRLPRVGREGVAEEADHHVPSSILR